MHGKSRSKKVKPENLDPSGLIPPEQIAEIHAAILNSQYGPELIDFLLRCMVKNPRRICIKYHGTRCHLLDYHYPSWSPFPLSVSRYSGSVQSESWGAHRGKPLAGGIFRVAAIIFGLNPRADFPKVYLIVRKRYEEFKRFPPPTETEIREIALKLMRKRKERCAPNFGSPRKTVSARQLWNALPIEIRREEFGASFYRFRDFLDSLAREDPTGGAFFRVERLPNGHGWRYRLLGME